MLRGVDVVDDKTNNKPSSAWPIPLNKNDEVADKKNHDDTLKKETKNNLKQNNETSTT
jgi:hypothetical protein